MCVLCVCYAFVCSCCLMCMHFMFVFVFAMQLLGACSVAVDCMRCGCYVLANRVLCVCRALAMCLPCA